MKPVVVAFIRRYLLEAIPKCHEKLIIDIKMISRRRCKIKLAKRKMYGRNSSLLLKAKLPVNEHF